MKVSRIKPYGDEYDRHGIVIARQYLCWMADQTVLTVHVPATYRGREKSRAARALAVAKWKEQQRRNP